MKKFIIIAFTFIFTCLFFVSNTINVNALTIDESSAGQVCFLTNDFENATTNIPDDNIYGTSYFVESEVIETSDVVITRNWIGAVIEREEIPIVEVFTYRYPILLDTHGQVTNSTNSSLVESDLSPEMLINGESSTATYTYSLSNTEYEYERKEWGINYTRNNYIGATIPLEGVTVGASLENEVEAYINDVYEYYDSSYTYASKTYSVTIENNSSSLYYQGGETIYFQHGTRYLFKLQVAVVIEYNYNVSSYTTGSWFSKQTHYDYSFSSSEFSSLYKDFIYYTYYSRYANPFVYVEDNYGTFVLIDELRSANRYYGD